MKRLTFARSICIALMVVVIAGFAVPVAYADPAAKKAEAEVVKAQLDTLADNLAIAEENYNEANVKYHSIVAKRDAAARKIKKLNGELAEVKGELSERALTMYRQGRLSFLDVLLGAQSFEDFASLWDTLNLMNDSDTKLVNKMNTLKAEQEEAKEDLENQKVAADKQLKIANTNKAVVQDKISENQQKLNSLNAEIKAEIEAIRKQQEAEATRVAQAEAQAAAAAAAARSSSNSGSSSSGSSSNSGGSSSDGGGAFDKTFPPPTRAARGEVVSIAKRYLGAPYKWAASGPNSFDCSGFTMFVYRQVGVSLPHSSRAQIGSGQRVSRGDLQPGDLVFFGSPIHHVGIYVGGGMMIHAPQTGDVVKISPLHSNYAGACRP